MMKKLILIALVVTPLLIQAQQKRVLFIGNSYTAYNNLPNLVKSVALSFGDSIIVDSNTPGGFTFSQHSTNATTLNKISQGNWDFVVLQAQSQEPSFPPSQVQSQTYPFAKNLCDSIRAYNPCTEPVFYMTWGRKNGDAANCAFYPVICTYEGMQMRLRQSYLEMGNDNNATVAPVGVAWKKIRDTDSTINLYNADGSHPSLWGSYLAACVFYTTLFKKPCMGAWKPASLNDDTAAFIQQIASSVVMDSLSNWYLGNLQLQNFEYTVNGYSANFNDLSINPGTVTWNFGDGSNGEGLNVQHTYADSGWYTVSQTISNACNSSYAETEIYISYSPQTSSSIVSKRVQWYTNQSRIYLLSDTEIKRVVLSDMLGRNSMVFPNANVWQSASLQQGVYLMQIYTTDGNIISGKALIRD